MIFSVVFLGLAVLTAAELSIEPKIQQEQVREQHQQQPIIHPEEESQVSEDANVIPFYKQVFNPYSFNLYHGYPKDRNFYGHVQKKIDYPLSFYVNKNPISYPYRNMFNLRYLNKLQPQVYHDSQDVYDYQDYVNQPLTDMLGDVEQVSSRKVGVDLPYSPSYFTRYNTYDLTNPLLDNYYGKNLELEYSKPSSYNIYGKLWDTEGMRWNFGRNLDVSPIGFPTIRSWETIPTSVEEMNLENPEPKISRSLNSGFVMPIIPLNHNKDPIYVKGFSPEVIQKLSQGRMLRNQVMGFPGAETVLPTPEYVE